jgi:hypothetical protein
MATAPPSTRRLPGTSTYLVAGAVVLALVLAAITLAVVLDEPTTTTATRGSGVTVSETRELPPFAAVDLAGVNNVTIGVGGDQRVVVRGGDDVIPLVTTEVESGTLVIAQSESFDTATNLGVEIVVPALESVLLSGSGTVTVDGHDLDLLALDLSGAGMLRGSGNAQRVDVELGGSGNVQLEALAAEEATVTLAGAGNVHVQVSERLDARVSGTGSVFYSGDPKTVTKEITGTGVIVER